MEENKTEMTDLERLRHSAAHVLAQAVKELFPDTKLGIGPVIEDGFYYDFGRKDPFTEEDLKKLEEKMKEISKRNLKIEKVELSDKEITSLKKSEPFKKELIDELSKKNIKPTFYRQGTFTDLCRGPHVNYTAKVKAFKLLKVSGAYWKGDQSNEQMQRIYGTCWQTKEELDNYLKRLEEAEKRDHRKLGKELELFTFLEESPGAAFFLPKGTIVYNELLRFIREEYVKRGYQEVITPLLYDKSLWETSGHWEHYREDLFLLKVDNRDFSLKPMNCPSHLLLYKLKLHSYKDLPLRIADFASLHRNEVKGSLGGLTRLRKFSQDDAHIFLAEEQIQDEISNLIDFVNYVYVDVFGFTFETVLSTRPEKALGEVKLWDVAEKALASALNTNKLKYTVAKGEGAFYGPKIDFKVKDAIGRTWQLATIQLDFNLPSRFNATYEGGDGKKHTPVMIHRAIFGSLERFIAVMTEHFAGKFPLWLSPVQVRLITVTDRAVKFAEEVKDLLSKSNLRAELDARTETIPKKVRDAQLDHIPLMVTIGDKEVDNKTLAVRTLDGKVKFGVKPNEFLALVKSNIEERKLEIKL